MGERRGGEHVAQNRLAAAGIRWRRLLLARAGWLAVAVWGLSVTLTALGLVLLALTRSHPEAYVFDFWAEYTTAAVGCSTVGAVISWCRPGHPIGWIFCAAGLLAAVKHFGAEYAAYALLPQTSPLPGADVLAWISTWIWVPSVGLFVFLGFLFPDGRLPDRRWRPLAWLSAAVILLGTVLVAFLPGPIDGLGPDPEPARTGGHRR
jgi:hypothetical protein